jgi:hypothetical protein
MAVTPSTPRSKPNMALEPCVNLAARTRSVGAVGAVSGPGHEALLTLVRVLARQAAAETRVRTMEPKLSEPSSCSDQP